MTEQEKLTVADAMTEYLEWRERRRRDDQFACHAKRMLARFGDQPVYWVQRKDVRKWIDDEIAPEYAHNTVSHIVNTGRALYSWLMRDDRVESNPFSGHEWKAEKTGIYIKPTVSEAEFQVIINMMENHPGARQAVTLAYYTGLRPSEAYRINPADFNHRDLELRVKVEKTVAGVRFVAIPRALSSWAVVQSQNWIEPNKITVQHAINCIRREHPALTGLCMASFRKNYAAIMEAAGASHEAINAHQGRRGSVLVNHYLKDPRRAVALMRPFIIQVFGDAGLQIHYSPIIHNG